MGLSPHIRGNVRLYRSTGRSAGSIPAHTGERGAIIRLGGVLIILLTLPLFLIHFKKIAGRRTAWHVQT